MMIRTCILLCVVLTVACGREATEENGDGAPAAAAPAEPAQTAVPPVLERRPAPQGAAAYIIEPADGAAVSSPVRVLFGLKGAGVAPAGIAHETAGHHHLLVDTGLPDLGLPVPADANHVHFGGGQTETEIELEPGTHTLQLLLGDERHVPHDPPIVSEPITIEVR
jgi:hypothetical protein